MIDERPPTVVRSRPARRRSRSDALLGVWGVLVLAFLFLPIAVIVVYSFNSGRLLTSWGGAVRGVHGRVVPAGHPRGRRDVAAERGGGGAAVRRHRVPGRPGPRAGPRPLGRRADAAARAHPRHPRDRRRHLAARLVRLPRHRGRAAAVRQRHRPSRHRALGAVDGRRDVHRAGPRRRLDSRLEEARPTSTRRRGVGSATSRCRWRRPGAGRWLMAFTLSLDNTIVASFVSLPGRAPGPSTCSRPCAPACAGDRRRLDPHAAAADPRGARRRRARAAPFG